MKKTLSLPPVLVDLVIPVFNEAEALPRFHAELVAIINKLPQQFTLTFVNDGSTDSTQSVLEGLAAADPRIRILELSRNFGHQAALTAGLDRAEGDYVITLDGDGQHPPALIPEMLRLAESGYDIVLTQRSEKQKLPPLKRLTSSWFYSLVNRIGDTHILPGGADFRLLSYKVVTALRGMREYHRFLRGMVAWAGYKSVILPYQPAARLAGTSKYTTARMVRLAMNATFSFSLVPLYISISLGAFFLILAVAEVIYVLNFWLRGLQSQLAPGWSSLMFMLLIVGGTVLVMLGIVGIYIGYIFQEVKQRPIYLLRSITPSPNAESRLEQF